MKYLNPFKIFESRKYVYVTHSHNIGPEIIENCEEILRDFNEENDCEVVLHMRYITDISFINKALPIIIAKNRSRFKEVSDWLGDKKDIIEFFTQTTEISTKSDILKRDFMKHIISYMSSLGYAFSFISGYYYFYKD